MKTHRILWIVFFALMALPLIVFYSCSDDDNDIINENIPVLTTTEVTKITQTKATSGGNITNDGGAEVTARGVIWSTSANQTVNNNEGITVDGAGAGSFTSNITGLEPETQYYVRAYATNSNGTGYGNALAFTTHEEPTGTVTDIDGNDYITVIIGNQEWMAENLRVTRYNNEDDILTGLSNEDWESTTEDAYAIYPHSSIGGLNSDEEVLEAYGALYNWYAVDDSRGLCPEGWSVPSREDLWALNNYVIDQGFPNEGNNPNGAGNALKSCRQVNSPLGGECNTSTHPRWNSDGTHHGFDEFGFSALPGGLRHTHGAYSAVGRFGYWWSATELNVNSAEGRNLVAISGGGFGVAYFSKSYGFSVRCFRDID